MQEIVGDLTAFGRRDPLTLFGGALVAGFALSGVLKEAKPRRSRLPLEEFRMTETNRPVADIIGDLFTQAGNLFQKETQLARAEMSENVASVGRGLGLVVGGAVLLIPGLTILLQAAVAALAENERLSSAWSALIVGGVTLIVGLILLMTGSGRLRADKLDRPTVDPAIAARRRGDAATDRGKR